MSSTANRIIFNTGWLYGKMAITVFISLYTTRLILNSLGVSDFGIFNIVGGAIGMLGFLNAAMESATQRFMSYVEGQKNDNRKKSIFNVSIILHFCIAVIVGIFFVLLGLFLFNGFLNIPEDRVFAAKIVYGSLVVSTLFLVITVPYGAVMNSHENMRFYAIVGIIESLLKLAVAFICVYTTSDKLIVYGVLMALIPISTLVVMRIYCHRKYEECVFAPRKYFDKSIMFEMSQFAGWNFIGSASSMVGNHSLGLVLNYFFGTILNAAQGIAYQLSGQLQAFSTNMLKALGPVIVKKEGAGERSKMIKATFTGCKLSYFLFAIFTIPAIIEMPYILRLWLKNVPEWAVEFSRLHLIRTMIEQVTITFGTAISAEGNIKRIQQITCVLNIMPIIFIIIAFSLGASPISMYIINITIFGLLLAGVKVYFMHINCGMHYKDFFYQTLIPIIVVSSITMMCAMVPLVFFEEGFVQLGVVILCSTIGFIFSVYIYGLNNDEREVVVGLLCTIKKRLYRWS